MAKFKTQTAHTPKVHYNPNMKQKTCQLGRHKYQYFETGEGEKTILFLHGLAGSKEGQDKLLGKIATNYRCIFLDLPDHNNLKSALINSTTDIFYYLSRFISENNLNNATLAGFSIGGNILLFYNDYLRGLNERTHNLIIWSSPLNNSLSDRSLMCLKLLRYLPKTFYANKIGSTFVKMLLKLMGINFSDLDFENVRRFNPKSLDYYMNFLITDYPLPCETEKCLYVYGTRDLFLKDWIFDSLKTRAPHHKKVLVENGGHFGTSEGHKLAADEIESFLGEI